MTGFDLGESAPDADEPEPGPESESEPESEPEQTDSSPEPKGPKESETEPDDSEPDPADAGPAFPYSEVKQSPLYAREETWNKFEKQLGIEVIPELRKQDVNDDELRELHDIVLEVAIDNFDEFPDRFMQKRRGSR